MTYKEIKLKDFIIEVDKNDKHDFIYDIYVFTKYNNFLFSYTNIHEAALDDILIDLEDMLKDFPLTKEDLEKGFNYLIDTIKKNTNAVIEGHKACEFNNYMIAYDEDNEVIVIFKDKVKLSQFNPNKGWLGQTRTIP